MTQYWADTSALLHWSGLEEKNYYINLSPLTLSELEHIKESNNHSENIKFRARNIVRSIMTIGHYNIILSNGKRVNKLLKKYNFLSNINDHYILCEAELFAIDHPEDHIIFLTADALQYQFALHIPHLHAIYTNECKEEKGEWIGWGRYYPNEQDMTMLYTDPKMNVLKAKTNEFCEIYSGSELKDVLFWTGSEYRPLKYKEMRNPYLDEVLKPRNLEQKMAFDLMQNKNIKVKLLTSAWGGGKTLIALTYALEQIGRGNYQKLLFVRNNIVVADTNDIGYLPGDLTQKMSIWGGPIADHLGGQEMLEQLIEEHVIEIFPLSHIRGRSLRNTIVICDECENMNDKLVTLLMSRIEEGSELIFCGDVAQIDHRKFEANNGIRSMLHNLSGEPLFGTVKLLKSERGPVAAMCDRMRPPI